MHLKWLS